MPGSEISNVPQNNSFAVCFTHLKSRRECKEDDTRRVKTKWGLDYRLVKIISCLEDGYIL